MSILLWKALNCIQTCFNIKIGCKNVYIILSPNSEKC